jgi:hypothetical protein
MALPFVGGPLNGQSETSEMCLIWDHNRYGLVWREPIAEDEPVLSYESLDTPMPKKGGYSLIIHRYILKCRGEFHISKCWLEYAGVVS